MKNIETFHPLSPVQQGMLFHTLDASASELCIGQSHWTLLAELDVRAFEQAWQRVIDRHAILRSSFWEGVNEPIQIVHRQLGFSLIKEDRRDLSAPAQQEWIEKFLETDKTRGFDLAQPPLMRFALIQVSDYQFEFVWTSHNLLLDGWSGSLLIDEVFSFYEAFRNGKDLNLEQSRPYSDYVAWLRKQDLAAAAEAYWRKTLSGFTEPTPLHIERETQATAEHESQYAEQQISLSTQETAALRSFSRERQVTLNTIAQAAWALLLCHYSGESDVVFGSVVSGRDAEFAGIESVLGPLANILPVRVRVTPGTNLTSWLRQLQCEQVEQRQYEYSSLAQVQKWSDVVQEQRLFDTVLLFASNPLVTRLQGEEQFLGAHQLTYSASTHYPITVTVLPGAQWRISITYDTWRFDRAAMRSMLNRFQKLLETMAQDPDRLLGDVVMLTQFKRARALYGPDKIELDDPHKQGLLSDKTPGWTTASTFVFMDHLPFTANGNAERKWLDAASARPELAQEFTPPRNRFEVAVASIWENALGIFQVGVHDNFFELGGHSLVATQIISRLSEHFEMELPLRTLFENPTVAKLAEEIARIQDQKVDLENERLLDMLEQLSDEEVQVVLKQRTGR